MPLPQYSDSNLEPESFKGKWNRFYAKFKYHLFTILAGAFLFQFAKLFSREAPIGAKMFSTLGILIALVALFLIIMKLLYLKVRDSKLY